MCLPLTVGVKQRFQSTPPSRVATKSADSLGEAITDFNPHHPRGWRRTAKADHKKHDDFNPHHPRGWRPVEPTSVEPTSGFQSTPPSRVATGRADLRGANLRISIHTTLAGGDGGVGRIFGLSVKISIHTTLAGGDSWR